MLMALWIQKQALSIKTSTIGVGEEECERADAEKHDDFELSRISFFSFIVALNLMVRFLSNSLPPLKIGKGVPSLSFCRRPGVQCSRIGVMEDMEPQVLQAVALWSEYAPGTLLDAGKTNFTAPPKIKKCSKICELFR